MKVSYEWLQSFFENPLPSVEEISKSLTFGVAEVEGVEKVDDDAVIDISVLPDRSSYMLSHRGVAKEISVLLDIPMKDDSLVHPVPELMPKSENISVVVDDRKRCPSYAVALMTGVKVGPSPDWLRRRLEAIGQRSINNVVDATNYVMLTLGTPLHAFDAKKMSDQNGIGIRVRAAKKGEPIIVLGDDEYELTEDMTIIADLHSDKALAIAGIKGGVEAEVGNDTSDIVLEAAKFDPVRTRKASQILKLRTDASHRFENEIADQLPRYGLEAIVKLIEEIAGGKLDGYSYEERIQPGGFKVGVSTSEVNQRLGTDLSENDIETIFKKHDFSYEKVTDPRARILEEAVDHINVPYKRGASVLKDSPDAFDCSSFIAWLFVQSGISIPRIVIDQFVFSLPIVESDLRPGDLVFSNTGEVLSTEGEYYSQVLGKTVAEKAIRTETLEWLPGTEVPGGVDHVGIFVGDGEVIHSASSIGHSVKERLNSSAQFKNIVGYRRVMDHDELRFVVTVPFERLDLRQSADLIEEIGRVYGYDNVPEVSIPPASVAPIINPEYALSENIRTAFDSAEFTEVYTYSLRDLGAVQLVNALASDKGHLRENLIDALTEKLGMNESNLPLLGMEALRMYEIGNVFTKDGEELHLAVAIREPSGKKHTKQMESTLLIAESVLDDALGVHLDPVLSTGESLEWNLSKISRSLHVPKEYGHSAKIGEGVTYQPFSIYPFVLRDIAAWTQEGTTADQFEKVIRDASGELLVRANIFDQFTKDGRTSYAFHLVFQSREKTLSDVEINEIMDRVYHVCKEAGFETR